MKKKMHYTSTTIKSKWTKTKWLDKSSEVREYIPKTLQFSRSNLSSMLSQYSTIFFKPENGTGGYNIIRIKKRENGYQYQHNSVKKQFTSLDTLYNELKKRNNREPYLLQQGIQLDKTNGKPFDIRVMVQKSRSRSWKSTGIFTKIGTPGKVATNYQQGGRIGFIRPTLLNAGYSNTTAKEIEAELKKLGKSVGKVFDSHKHGFHELGLDVALDKNGEIWILEVNTRPQFYPLKHMKDKTLYQHILSNAKKYGRKR
ncbi:YheC/YheD family protein [Paenibacillus provencensis]|uniref:YheC/YheD family protein n=1 Tax=Paenibacillus provencensis TaxID=441151 RepID=A0ABW3PR42_9BACL|nr:YheC/YheD family protein [Paenibacillus sp. MER 78]MCM3128080.1 YheC/YheD family protein [Paenibacillus sp. MER 78]